LTVLGRRSRPASGIEEVFRGVAPFVIMMAVCIVIPVVFPQISLFLPAMMRG
jgi:TRAP-type C4-dicarboxylate transport system permease large subunit